MNLRDYQTPAVEYLSKRRRGLVCAPAGSVGSLTNGDEFSILHSALVRLQKAHEH